MAKARKYPVQVRSVNGQVETTISRTLIGVAFGNFNPIFCRYNGVQHLVHSDVGDMSDPFRRDSTYFSSLHIVRP